jgi:hypothetical protein
MGRSLTFFFVLFLIFVFVFVFVYFFFFCKVARFHSNLERTKQSIKDILVMFEKLNAVLPPELQEEALIVHLPPPLSHGDMKS